MQKIEQPQQSPSVQPVSTDKAELDFLLQSMENVLQSGAQAPPANKSGPDPSLVQSSTSGDFDLDALLATMDNVQGKTAQASRIEGKGVAGIDGNIRSGAPDFGWIEGKTTPKSGMEEFEDLLSSLESPKPQSPQLNVWKAGAKAQFDIQQPRDQRRNTMAEIDTILSSLSQSVEELNKPVASSQSMSFTILAPCTGFYLFVDAALTTW